MKKILQLALSAGVLLLSMNIARAANFTFDASAMNPLTPPASVYHVTLNQIDSTHFSLLVTGDAANPAGVHDVDLTSLNFFNTIIPTGPNADLTPFAGNRLLLDPLTSSMGTVNSTSINYVNTPWIVGTENGALPGFTLQGFAPGFPIPPAQDRLSAYHQNELAGIIEFATPGGADMVKGVTASFQDGGQQWYGAATVPEASSLALLLPGLIPLGLAIRRRRAKRA